MYLELVIIFSVINNQFSMIPQSAKKILLLLLLFICSPTFLIAQNNSTISIENTFKKIDGFYGNEDYDSILFYSKRLLPLTKNGANKKRVLEDIGIAPVSYTHLTLPTILLV